MVLGAITEHVEVAWSAGVAWCRHRHDACGVEFQPADDALGDLVSAQVFWPEELPDAKPLRRAEHRDPPEPLCGVGGHGRLADFVGVPPGGLPSDSPLPDSFDTSILGIERHDQGSFTTVHALDLRRTMRSALAFHRP